MKKMVSMLMVLTLCFAMGACSAKEDNANMENKNTEAEQSQNNEPEAVVDEVSGPHFGIETESDSGEGKTIGVAHFTLLNDFNTGLNEAYMEYFESHGYTVNATNAMNSTSQQLSDIENFISSGVDGIIIAGGEAAAFPGVVQKAVQAGIPVVCVDMVQADASYNCSADNYTGGAQMGLYLINKINSEGKVMIIGGAGWKSLGIRYDMMKYIMQDYDKIEIVAEQEVDADPINDAYSATKSVLQANPDLKAVACTWGLPAVGAAQAIEEMGLSDQICIVCADSDMSILEAMGAEGVPSWATIGQDSMIFGHNAAEAMDLILNGYGEQVPFAEYGPTYMTTNDMSGFGTFDYASPDELWNIAYSDYENPLE